MIPKKLQKGDEIRVIAPSLSLSLVSETNVQLAKEKLEDLGFIVTFSKNCKERDIMISSSVKSRIDDIHEAFSDKNVKAIFTIIGGFNSNQLLKYLDYDLIRSNPKIFCGYSDITAIANAITHKTDIITYSGLHFSTLAMQKESEYNIEYFKKCLTSNDGFSVEPSKTWSDDAWYIDQENRDIKENLGYLIINQGEAHGKILGGNLCTFNLLKGTEFMPDIKDSIFFIEDDDATGDNFSVEFDRNLQSLIHQPNFNTVRALLIGRFQKNVDITEEKLRYILQTKEELNNIPIIANVDFGHTNPMITFPIGGIAKISVKNNKVDFRIIEH
ncbi:MAG TPA: LD-carboxypeptidase [bacterium]|nr:LD-carboxypeptidase [bacterium]HOG38222.1 LD-carboxypeptidase [bacterium]HQI03188.1 LD-carboxypeptidase [bacterium]